MFCTYRKFRGIAVSLIIPVCASACSIAPLKMKLAPELSTVEPLSVQGHSPRFWNDPISFGPWHTTEVREGTAWTIPLPQLLSGSVSLEANVSSTHYQVAVAGTESPI